MVPVDAEDALTTARDFVAQLFSIMGIDRVVVVDDAYSASPQVADILGACIAFANAGKLDLVRTIPQFKDLELPADDVDICRRHIEAVVNEMDEDERKSIAVQLVDAGDQRWDQEDLTRTALNDLLSAYDVKQFSLQEWQSARDTLLSPESAQRTLFLFDQDMTANGGSDSEGIAIIADLLRNSALPAMHCGLVSHTVPEHHEFDTWNKLARDNDLDNHKGRFAVLSKAHLRSDPQAFAFRLKRVAISPRCDSLKTMVCEAIEKAHNAATQRLNSLNIYDFEQIVFQSSYLEGVWEADTLIRIFNLFHRDEARKIASANADLRRTADDVRRVVTLPFKPTDAPKSSSCKIRRLELYEDGEFLNAHHCPVELGEVFQKTNGSKQFILIGQPCELMVRGDGRRHGLAEVVLAKVVRKEPRNKRACFKLAFFDAETFAHAWVDFHETISVKTSILDLAAFQSDGSTQLTLDQPMPSRLIPAWQERFAVLNAEFATTVERYGQALTNAGGQLSASADDAMQHMLTNTVTGVVKGSIKFQGAKAVSYDFRRVCRLKEPIASAMLRSYAGYFSRDAFEHDFTRAIHQEGSTETEEL